MDISVVIITLNEEKNIARCIDSVSAIADEVIVVDSGSTDSTEEIVRSRDAQFYSIQWTGYGAARNYGVDRTSYNYILSLDADEALSDKLQESITRLKLKNDHLLYKYSFNILPNYCGSWIKHCGWYPGTKVRLYDKNSFRWNMVPVHEALVSIKESVSDDVPIEHLSGDLLHYSYYSREEHRERADRYSTLTAQLMSEKGKKASKLKPIASMIFKFISIYILRLGFLDGKAGFDIARISAISNKFKYEELRRLNRIKNV